MELKEASHQRSTADVSCMDDAKATGQSIKETPESLEKGYDRFQKLLSQLDALRHPKDIISSLTSVIVDFIYHNQSLFQQTKPQATAQISYSFFIDTTTAPKQQQLLLLGLAAEVIPSLSSHKADACGL
ncbi:hypothetical protein Tco_1456580 [Tanacetum coccineum]